MSSPPKSNTKYCICCQPHSDLGTSRVLTCPGSGNDQVEAEGRVGEELPQSFSGFYSQWLAYRQTELIPNECLLSKTYNFENLAFLTNELATSVAHARM